MHEVFLMLSLVNTQLLIVSSQGGLPRIRGQKKRISVAHVEHGLPPISVPGPSAKVPTALVAGNAALFLR